MKATVSGVFEDIKLKISEDSDQNWSSPGSALLAVSALMSKKNPESPKQTFNANVKRHSYILYAMVSNKRRNMKGCVILWMHLCVRWPRQTEFIEQWTVV